MGPLSDDEVVKSISRQCVPVAINRELMSKDKTAVGDLYRSIQKQRPDQYQGIYIIDPDGKVLANQAKPTEDKNLWAKDLRDRIDAGVKAYGEVTRRPAMRFSALDDRGVGTRKDGSVILAVYARHLLLGLDKRGFGDPTYDSVVLTSEERAHFGQKEAKSGTTWKVPATVVKHLHKVLAPNSDPNTLARADEVTFAKLEGKVERVSRGIAYLRFTGRITGTHIWEFPPNKGKEIQGDVTLIGVGTCDATTGELRSITLVGAGEHRNYPPYDNVVKYGAVVEWKAKK